MAETLRVDLVYRPLRIGWAVQAGDITSIRTAMRYSHALWGGRFNPILIVDRDDEARNLVELFRVDFIMPVGSSAEVRDFPKKFPHLIKPIFGDTVFVNDERWHSHFSHVLDIYNGMVHGQSSPHWNAFKDQGVRDYRWQSDDPLADVLLMQLGGFPTREETGIDYAELVSQAVQPATVDLRSGDPLPADIPDHPGFAAIGRIGLERHYAVRPGWDYPGFFVGDAGDPDDIVCCWNLRACDIPLWFVDRAHWNRFTDLVPEWRRTIQGLVDRRRDEWTRRLGVWSRQDIEVAAEPFADMQLSRCRVRERFWSGGAVSPPMMHFGEVSTLGVMEKDSDGRPRVNFALANKPFSDDVHFHNQHLVLSLSFSGSLYGDEQNTFDVPYVPELNEFYARTMHFQYNALRVEPDRIGLIVHATTHDSFVAAMPVADLVQRIFQLGGFASSLSTSGRIARQLLTQLGGVQGARVFKIPGARSLLKKYGPRDTFTRDMAKDTIVDKTPEHRNGSFAAHKDLFLGPRPFDTRLTPPDVFAYMVDKGLFRIGVELDCPKCGMSSWMSLDGLKQRTTCELCGNDYDATRQLIASNWRFRRSGVLGSERGAQGAVPVALTLQQLDTTLDGLMRHSLYSPSLDLKLTATPDQPGCEVDFVWVVSGRYPEKTTVLLAECKDQGAIKLEEFQRDLDNLRRVADALPRNRFETFLLYAKLAPFTPEEIEAARAMNEPRRDRVILLSAKELEPYQMFERHEEQHGQRAYASTVEGLAQMTSLLYFTQDVPPAA